MSVRVCFRLDPKGKPCGGTIAWAKRGGSWSGECVKCHTQTRAASSEARELDVATDGQDHYLSGTCPACDSPNIGPHEVPHRVICEVCGVFACGSCTVYDEVGHRYLCDECSPLAPEGST